jgi:serine/threonine protein kinase
VWALGMIYYEMLTGRPLDNGKEMTNTYNMVRVGGRFVPQGLSKLSETILLECIKFDFNRRIGIKQLNDLVNGNKAVQ